MRPPVSVARLSAINSNGSFAQDSPQMFGIMVHCLLQRAVWFRLLLLLLLRFVYVHERYRPRVCRRAVAAVLCFCVKGVLGGCLYSVLCTGIAAGCKHACVPHPCGS